MWSNTCNRIEPQAKLSVCHFDTNWDYNNRPRDNSAQLKALKKPHKLSRAKLHVSSSLFVSLFVCSLTISFIRRPLWCMAENLGTCKEFKQRGIFLCPIYKDTGPRYAHSRYHLNQLAFYNKQVVWGPIYSKLNTLGTSSKSAKSDINLVHLD